MTFSDLLTDLTYFFGVATGVCIALIVKVSSMPAKKVTPDAFADLATLKEDAAWLQAMHTFDRQVTYSPRVRAQMLIEIAETFSATGDAVQLVANRGTYDEQRLAVTKERTPRLALGSYTMNVHDLSEHFYKKNVPTHFVKRTTAH